MQPSLRMTYSIVLLTQCSYLGAAGTLSITDSLPAAGRPYTTNIIYPQQRILSCIINYDSATLWQHDVTHHVMRPYVMLRWCYQGSKLPVYTVSQKNCANLSFCSLSVKYKPISIKIGRLSWNKPLTKLCLKCPLHLMHVLALPWKSCSVRLSRQRNN